MSKIFSSQGTYETEKRNVYQFSTSASDNARARVQAFIGLLLIAAIVIFIVVKF